MACSARANSSLPTPVSPSSSTEMWLAAPWRSRSNARLKPGEMPIMSAGSFSFSPIVERNCTTWVCRSINWSAMDSGVK